LREPEQSVAPERPDISIVIPAWGAYAGPMLREALESLRSQEVRAHVIVVDNASETPVQAADADEVLRSSARLTVGAARNLGLARVETPYVLFWDADDLMLPGTLRHLRARIEAEPHLVAVTASILEGDPPVPHRWPRPWAARLARRPRAFAVCNSVWGIYPTTGSTIMRAAVVREAGGFGSGHGGDDWVLGVSLAFRGRVAFGPAPGRLYRQHAGSLLRQNSSTRHLIRRAAAVRTRLREDSGVPRWVRPLLPGIAAGQLLAVLGLNPLVRARRAFATWTGEGNRPTRQRD